MIVVDIQGVGDLYTDPQIHTAKADEYGDANLGIFLVYCLFNIVRRHCFGNYCSLYKIAHVLL